MLATFLPATLSGRVDAPPSKSMAHRYLIGAALSGEKCRLFGVDYSEDILASIDCLRALGASVAIDGDMVEIDPADFLQVNDPVLPCRESGSTLRFFIPLALTLGCPVRFLGAPRLMQRPLSVYETLAAEEDFLFAKEDGGLTVCGALKSKNYTLAGDVSSQFITGLLFALVHLSKEAVIHITPPFESRSYVNLTLSALQSFGANVSFADEYTILVRSSKLSGWSGPVEGDYSNAAFLDAFNHLGSEIKVGNLKADSLQGDRVYAAYFDAMAKGTPTLDISDCPDLGPVLFALAAMQNGATFTGTDRLRVKESDRGQAMNEELSKLGGGLIFGDNTITVPKCSLQNRGIVLNGHNDHRIVMAMSLILSKIGGAIDGAEAVKKSYPAFFETIKSLGAEVTLS